MVGLLVLTGVAAGHVPAFPEANDDPDNALEVPDAVKSWSFYDEVAPGGAKYYRLVVPAGERLRLEVFTPASGGFAPGLVVMSPSLAGTEDVPEAVTVPDGMGAEVHPGERPDAASYEPFAPSANYHTASVDRPVAERTEFVVAIYATAGDGGPAGLAVGSAESFSATEYLTVPFDLVAVHRWEGQPAALVYAPWLLAALVAGGLAWRRREGWNAPLFRGLLLGGAALVAGSGLSTLLQLGIAGSATGLRSSMAVTAAFVAIPLVVGAWAGRRALAEPVSLAARDRAALVVGAVLAAATWAGFLVGPAALAVVAILPRNKDG